MQFLTSFFFHFIGLHLIGFHQRFFSRSSPHSTECNSFECSACRSGRNRVISQKRLFFLYSYSHVILGRACTAHELAHLRSDWLRPIKVEISDRKKRLNIMKNKTNGKNTNAENSVSQMAIFFVYFIPIRQAASVQCGDCGSIVSATSWLFRNVKVIELISILHAVCRSTPRWRVRVFLLIFQLLSVNPIVFTECRVWLMVIVADDWTNFSRIVYGDDDRASDCTTMRDSCVSHTASRIGLTANDRTVWKRPTHTLRHGRAN